MGHNVIFLVIGIMLVVGVVFAVVWWHLADLLFPGTAKKTGQRILPLGDHGKKAPPAGAKVIRFDDQPPTPR